MSRARPIALVVLAILALLVIVAIIGCPPPPVTCTGVHDCPAATSCSEGVCVPLDAGDGDAGAPDGGDDGGDGGEDAGVGDAGDGGTVGPDAGGLLPDAGPARVGTGDEFQRTVVGGWGNADIGGEPWLCPTVAASVDGNNAFFTLGLSGYDGCTLATAFGDVDIVVNVGFVGESDGASITVAARADATHNVGAELLVQAGALTLRAREYVDPNLSVTNSIPLPNLGPTDSIDVHLVVFDTPAGRVILANAWRVLEQEPPFAIELVADAPNDIASGAVLLGAFGVPGDVFRFDHLVVDTWD